MDLVSRSSYAIESSVACQRHASRREFHFCTVTEVNHLELNHSAGVAGFWCFLEGIIIQLGRDSGFYEPGGKRTRVPVAQWACEQWHRAKKKKRCLPHKGSPMGFPKRPTLQANAGHVMFAFSHCSKEIHFTKIS